MEPSRRFSSELFACSAAVVLAIWLVITLHGGGVGAENGAIYVLDPRRVLNDPTLWLIAAAILALGAISRAKFTERRHFLWVIGLTCFFLTAMASLPLNFAPGRYASARTLIGVWMVLLGLIYVADQSRTICDRDESAAPSTFFALNSVVIAILSINLTASSMFLHEWNEVVTAFSSIVNTDPSTGTIEIVSEDQLRTLLGPAGSKFNERMGFSWTWLYRSIVAAKAFRPGHVIADSEEALAQCKALSLQTRASRTPADMINTLSRFACAQPAPLDQRYFRQWLLNCWKSRDSAAPDKAWLKA
jgi:hypothetical protein